PLGELTAGFARGPQTELIYQAALFGQRDEARRRDVAELRMMPARQGLDAIQQAVAHAYLRLVVQAQLALLKGFAQGAFQGQTLLGQLVQLVAEEAVAAAAGALGLVH